MWAVGCILAELLGGRAIFRGRDYVDQLNQILHKLGTPNEETLKRVGSPRVRDENVIRYVADNSRLKSIFAAYHTSLKFRFLNCTQMPIHKVGILVYFPLAFLTISFGPHGTSADF